MALLKLNITEQVLQMMPVAVWFREREPSSMDEVSQLAEDDALARKGQASVTVCDQQKPLKRNAGGVSRDLEVKESFRREWTVIGKTKMIVHGEKQCFHCNNCGHLLCSFPKTKRTSTKG